MKVSDRRAGFSLVELMVSMALSLVLLGGVASIFVSSRTTYEASDRLARIEEDGRFALNMIVRDLRAAGYVGCSKRAAEENTVTTLRGGGGAWRFDLGVEGFNGSKGSGWTPPFDSTMVPEALDASDVLLVRVPRPGNLALRVTKAMASGTDVISVPKFPTGHEGAFRDHQILMISDCSHRAIFEVTKYDPQGGTIEHAISDATESSPGNESNDFKHRYLPGAAALSLQRVVYYVRNNASDIPSLYRRVDQGAAEELVAGIEQMQLSFGEDTNPSADTDRIADISVTPNLLTRPTRIISVTVALLVRSSEPYGAKEARTYQLLGQNVATDDRYMRKVFTTTASVRNVAM